MNWLWIVAIGWVALAIPTAVLIGRAIHVAEKREAGSHRYSGSLLRPQTDLRIETRPYPAESIPAPRPVEAAETADPPPASDSPTVAASNEPPIRRSTSPS